MVTFPPLVHVSDLFVACVSESTIDPMTGVDFSLQSQAYGPVSLFTIEMFENSGGTGWTATGNATFGFYQSQETAFDIGYDNFEEVYLTDPEDKDNYITVAWANVCSSLYNVMR